jgi:hypothetical protein
MIKHVNKPKISKITRDYALPKISPKAYRDSSNPSIGITKEKEKNLPKKCLIPCSSTQNYIGHKKTSTHPFIRIATKRTHTSQSHKVLSYSAVKLRNINVSSEKKEFTKTKYSHQKSQFHAVKISQRN